MSRFVTLTEVKAELELRQRRERKRQEPIWDWYGEDCACPEEDRLEDGSCPIHPRVRGKQRPPVGDWRIWYLQMGRGWGKTRCGAEWVRHQAEWLGERARVALVAATAADARDVMVEGPSGIMNVCPPWDKPLYEPSKRRVTWQSGARAITYSADEPDRLRGPDHSHAWCDELAAWRDPAAWDMLMFGLRRGTNPQAVITTTPKPHQWLRAIKAKLGTVVVTGSTYENRPHLARAFFSEIIDKHEGTRLGRQELEAEDLVDTPGALWHSDLLDMYRIPPRDRPELVRVVVGVDPSVKDQSTATTEEDSSEAGITVAGCGPNAHGYLVADRSLRASPRAWAEVAVAAYHEFQADVIVAEINNGGAMVGEVLRAVDPRVNFKLVHASRGKVTRAEPVASLYEQGKIHHCGFFPALEEQMCHWVPGMKSPDRMDALVWAFHELMLVGSPITYGGHPWEEWR